MADARIRFLITPPVHTTGVYSLYSPWTVALTDVYRCHAIRSFDELIRKGIDVYADYYEPMGVSESIYKEDLALGASIVTLISAVNEYLYVPNTYIESYPGMSGIKYSRKCVLLDLGPLPDNFSITYLLDDIQSLIKKGAGVVEEQVNIRMATIPMTTTVTHEDHIQLEATRRAAIQLHVPLAVQLSEQTARADALQEQNDLLLNVISEHPELFTEL